MDARKLAVHRPCFALGFALLSLWTLAEFSQAGNGQHFDGSTLCRWNRTSHGPNSIWQPLRPYFVPRPPDPCLHGGYGHACRHAADIDGYADSYVFEANGNPPAVATLPDMQVGLERLGQIPNDMGIAGGAAEGRALKPGR